MMDLTPATVIIAGVVAVICGTVVLLAGIGRKQPEGKATTALLAAAVLGTTTLGWWLANGADWVTTTGIGLASAWLLFAVLRMGMLSALAQRLARPLVQAGLLVAGGIAATTFGAWKLECDLQKDIANSDLALTAMTAPEFDTEVKATARTDADRTIPLKHLRYPDQDSASFHEVTYLRKQNLDTHLIQTGPVDSSYNCHGWVFAAGRHWVGGTNVPDILEDNGYRLVKKPRAGDVAVFTDGAGLVAHTGLVRGHTSCGAVLMESKWGKLGRYIHTADQHMYLGCKVAYWRTDRGSHTLAGIVTEPGEIEVSE